ncbi:AraC family transcriptional regulator [Paenibacillus lupini]|uniref:response regulator n=1 Tax=Paenibacillus lupini TaxID=1450204 RepID=UPI001421ABEE|nr:AraC family transcriptional regulator [Paenibacillus lupini]NIK26038.1 two-component system response regulator YesN [Paenibacillus lupini]
MKIMIVDDEVIIRNGLSTVINWEELGFKLLPPAASAEEALARFPDEQPNIVLSDIQMTGMNGINLAAEIKMKWPDTEIIILTGFDMFSYAQQAIREGVSDYLLKSSRPEEIIRAAMKAKQRLQVRWESIKKESRGRSAFRDRLLESLTREGTLSDQSVESASELLPHLGLEEPPLSLQVLLLAASGWGGRPDDSSLAHFAVANIVQEILPCETLLHKDRVLVVMNNKAGETVDKLEKELGRVSRKLKCKLYVAVGSTVGSIEELRRSFKEAEHAFTYRSISSTNEDTFIRYELVKDRTGGKRVCSEEEEARFIAIAKSGSIIDLRHWVDETIAAQLSDPEVTPDSLQAYLNSIVLSGHRFLERVTATVGEPPPVAEPLRPDVLNQSENSYVVLFRLLNSIMDLYRETMSGDRVSYIKRAITYIRDHLDRNLTLQQVAKHVHLNPNHFSEVFKRETGFTYIEFVTKERISRAKELLDSTPIKISDIAGRVGYEDVKYFGQLFKKATGQTPSEYRNKT